MNVADRVNAHAFRQYGRHNDLTGLPHLSRWHLLSRALGREEISIRLERLEMASSTLSVNSTTGWPAALPAAPHPGLLAVPAETLGLLRIQAKMD